MQSGLFRAGYGQTTAHDCIVRGVASDALNLTTITCSENGEVTFWPFKDKKKLSGNVVRPRCQIKLEDNLAINSILLHRER
jgi:hypothetical protein